MDMKQPEEPAAAEGNTINTKHPHTLILLAHCSASALIFFPLLLGKGKNGSF